MPHLDALRGIAALIVAISHCANAGLLPPILGVGFGRMSVGLFFVLSAFLLTTLYTGASLNMWSARQHLVRRFARVLPLFYVALLASLLIEVLTGLTVFEAFDSPPVAIMNTFLIHGTSVLWSIPVELQFYFVFLALMNVDFKLAFGFLIMFQVIIGLAAIYFDIDKNSLPYWMHFFTVGCALAVAIRNKWLISKVSESNLHKPLIFLSIPTLSILVPLAQTGHFGFSGLPIMVDPLALLWVLCVSSVFIFKTIPINWVQNKFFGILGQLSFGVYLIHIAVIEAVSLAPLENSIEKFTGFVLVIIVSYFLAAVSYRFVERPAQKWVVKSCGNREIYSS